MICAQGSAIWPEFVRYKYGTVRILFILNNLLNSAPSLAYVLMGFAYARLRSTRRIKCPLQESKKPKTSKLWIERSGRFESKHTGLIAATLLK